MKWWKDLWLNEGFASFVEYVGVDQIEPEWKMMEQFVLEKTQPALALDALASSHSISVEVHDPREIEAIFDTISYSKVKYLVLVQNFHHMKMPTSTIPLDYSALHLIPKKQGAIKNNETFSACLIVLSF